MEREKKIIRSLYLRLSYFDLYEEYKRLQKEIEELAPIVEKSVLRMYLKECEDVLFARSIESVKRIHVLTASLTPETRNEFEAFLKKSISD